MPFGSAALPASLPPSGAAGGDLTGIYPNPTLAATKIALTLLADTTLVVAAASIDVTGLSQSYTTLRLEAKLRGTTAAQNIVPLLRLNGDSGANYRWAFVFVQTGDAGASVLTSGATSSIRIGLCPGASANANAFSWFVVEISEYSNATTFKAARTQDFSVGSGGASTDAESHGGGVWLSTAAVTQVTLLPDANNLAAGSRLRIFGY